jgi:predicted component of type VI protein secretion system
VTDGFDERAEAPLAEGWGLEGADGEGREVRLVFGEDELAKADLGLTIGRHPQLSDRTIDDPTVSRRHLRIGLRSGALFAEDVNSLNGTLLDGQELMPFQAVVLREDQTLTLGRSVLRVRRTGDRPRRTP